jgi:hypothetical protein
MLHYLIMLAVYCIASSQHQTGCKSHLKHLFFWLGQSVVRITPQSNFFFFWCFGSVTLGPWSLGDAALMLPTR